VKLDVRIPYNVFMNEAKDFSDTVKQDFFKTSLFGKEFKLEKDHIHTQIRI
jgi:hypothetical protein